MPPRKRTTARRIPLQFINGDLARRTVITHTFATAAQAARAAASIQRTDQVQAVACGRALNITVTAKRR